MWEVDYLLTVGRLRPESAQRVLSLVETSDTGTAWAEMVAIESAVAPVSGGLADDAPAVVSVVIAGLPLMDPATRVDALLLLTQVLGSAEASGGEAAAEVGRLIEAALPTLARVIESGSEADLAQGVDLISMAALQSRASAERAAHYLASIAQTASGPVRESAERELAEVGRLLT